MPPNLFQVVPPIEDHLFKHEPVGSILIQTTTFYEEITKLFAILKKNFLFKL